MPIDNQIASRHWRSRRAIPTTFRAAPNHDAQVSEDNRRIVKDTTQPREGVTGHNVRYVLIGIFVVFGGLAMGSPLRLRAHGKGIVTLGGGPRCQP